METPNIQQLIDQTKTVSPENVPNLLSSISDYINKYGLTDNEKDNLIDLILNLISTSPPSIQRSTYSLCNTVFDVVDFSSQTLSVFSASLLNHLKTTLSSSPDRSKVLYDEALLLTRNILKIIGADSFWKTFSVCFLEKSPNLKIVSLDLLFETLNIEENFKTSSFIQSVFKLLREKSNQDIKKRAFDIAGLLYKRHPDTVVKLLKKMFLFDANPIIEQIQKNQETNEEVEVSTFDEVEESMSQAGSQIDDFDKMSTSSRMSKVSRTSSRLSTRSTKKESATKKEKCPIPVNRKSSNRQSIGSKKKSHIPVKGSYAAGASAGENNMSPEEIERSIILEFESPLPEQLPKTGFCPISEISTKLIRELNNNWEDRAQQLEMLVGYARGSQNKAQFVRNLNVLKDGLESCVNDSRSSLSKRACICISAIAEALENKIDFIGDWILPLVVVRAGKDTFTLPAELASLSIIKSVGFYNSKGVNAASVKATRRSLEDLAKHKNEKVRIVTVKCIATAIEYWTQDASSGLEKILEEKTHDKSEKVRSLASSFLKSLVATRAASAQIRTEDVILDDDDETEEINEDQVETEDEETKPKIDRESLFEEEALHGESLKGLVDQGNIELITTFIQQTKCNLLGFVQPIVQIIIDGFQSDSIQNIRDSTNLLSLLCANYSNSLYPFLTMIGESLPNNDTYCKIAISKLSSAFGNNPIARLFLNSGNLSSSACEFVLKFAEQQNNNINFVIKSVFAAVHFHHYETYNDLILKLIKKIHSYDSIRCEALVSSLEKVDRDKIIVDAKHSIPQLYHAFIKDDSDTLSDKLCVILTNIKSNKIKNNENSRKDSNGSNSDECFDSNLLKKVEESNSDECLLLAIAIIREIQSFLKNDFVSFLLKCTANENKEIAIASSLALTKHAKSKTISIDDFLNNFVISDGAFKTLTELMKNYEISDSHLNEINKKVQEGICSFTVKYSALSVIAYVSKNICDSFLNSFDELSFVNKKILESIM